MVKICSKCGHEKLLVDFYRDAGNKDGRQGLCKECQKAVSTKARRSNLESYRAYDRERAKLPHRIETAIARTRKRRKVADGYMRAHNMVSRALKSKAMERLPCQMCGTTEWVAAHHDDYSKPLEVMWLCPAHHSARHAYLEYLESCQT